MVKIDIAGLKADAISKKELLDTLRVRISQGQKTFITTLYSEFLYAALKDRKNLEMLNKADIAVADGIGIMWAVKYLSIPLTAENYWLKILQAFWQMVYSGAAIIFKPTWIKSIIPEKIVGADLIWDLAKLAADNDWSIYLLGGFGDTPRIAGERLRSKYPDLKILGCSDKNSDDPTIIQDIKNASPDLLFVAYGPIKQEAWIACNLPNLPVKLAIGLGGTFDYLAGKHANPPRFMRQTGLEWLFRLLTQPRRIKRIFKATFGLIGVLIKYKVFINLPFRQNVASVVLDPQGRVFIARFNPDKEVLKALGYSKKKGYDNYWQLPQGGLQENEDAVEGARRELWEETAMRNLELLKKSSQTYSYTWKDIAQRPLLVRQRYRYKGQEQHIVYFRFRGPEKEIVLDWDEFLEYKWVPWQDLEKEVHDEKKPLAKIVLEDLKNLA